MTILDAASLEWPYTLPSDASSSELAEARAEVARRHGLPVTRNLQPLNRGDLSGSSIAAEMRERGRQKRLAIAHARELAGIPAGQALPAELAEKLLLALRTPVPHRHWPVCSVSSTTESDQEISAKPGRRRTRSE